MRNIHPLAYSLLQVIAFAALLNVAESQPVQPETVETNGTSIDGITLLLSKQKSEPLSKLERILIKHFESSPLRTQESLIIKGTYTTQGTELEHRILVKRPGLLRQTISSRGVHYIGNFDGNNYWHEGPSVEEDPLTELNEGLLFIECNFAALLWDFETSGSSNLQLLEITPFEGQPCYVIENKHRDPFTILHFIDVETGIEIGRKSTLVADSASYDILLIYAQSVAHPPNEHTFPRGYKLFLNDELYAEAKISSVRFNAGVMPWSFSKE